MDLQNVRLERWGWTVQGPVPLSTMDDCAKACVTVPYTNSVITSMDVWKMKQKVR